MKAIKKNHLIKGFTLIELITVIVLLGILSVGISSFLNFGTQIFVDATNRDEIISTARFSVERLNRELRKALPNSVRATDNGNSIDPITRQCIEYTPII